MSDVSDQKPSENTSESLSGETRKPRVPKYNDRSKKKPEVSSDENDENSTAAKDLNKKPWENNIFGGGKKLGSARSTKLGNSINAKAGSHKSRKV